MRIGGRVPALLATAVETDPNFASAPARYWIRAACRATPRPIPPFFEDWPLPTIEAARNVTCKRLLCSDYSQPQ